MRIAPNHRVQQAAVAGVVLAMLGITGCSVINEQSTTREYAASDGIVENLGPVELRNILIVSTDEGTPGTLLGTVFNSSDQPVQVTIQGENEMAEITVEADGKYVFEEEVADDGTLQGISDIPGSLVDLDFTVESETATYGVPVVDGTLAEYREFVPGGYTPEPSEPAATEEAHGGE
ncbi:hypothetical protein ACX80W_08400 [Arthrobacter sp. TMN-37]